MKSKKIVRIGLVTGFILLLPLVAMQFTNEVNWNLADFVIMGALIFGTGFLYEWIARRMKNATNRVILGVVLLAIFLLIWADLAVGIFNVPGFSGSYIEL